MPGTPRLTFAIPYYRGRDYLAEAIRSVLAQTEQDWRLLVVDDRGPEPADELVADFDDPRIDYVRNERNLGLAGNWNECVRLATTPYVTVLHGDDRLLPEYAAHVLAAADREPDAAVVFTDAVNIDGDGRPTRTLADVAKGLLPRRREDHVLSGDADLAGLLAGNYIVCPTMCLRRDLVGEAPFDASLRFVPDWELTTRLLMEGGRLAAVRTPLLEYRRHGGSETSLQTEDASRFVEEIAFLRRREEQLAALGWSASARSARRRTTVRGHLAVLTALDLVRGHRAAARAKWTVLRGDLRRR
ncbi:glycosyltransferase family 2 protein [Nocardioides sediminis]|uniref:glycosyltransferase family 2 protein n=1 Tax=Nocardioides sediminis TaxID=433648 RepID=UPI00131F143B|nr:glycosyltransferase [Nocardioides sediminis]